MFPFPRLLLAVFALCILAGPTPQALGKTPAFEESPDIAQLFTQAGVNATFVVYDVAAQKFSGYNATRATLRFIPASTFKIPNSLIGLTVGAVPDVETVFYRHDGTAKFLQSWEKDMGLREAIRVSNVPAYQELARRIGMERMRRSVQELDYGNAATGEAVDRFWLQGPLAISAVEQTRFLARLAAGTLPCPPQVQAAVRDICKLEEGEGWTLFGKTGLASAASPSIGWFVGWVARPEGVFAFALNMDITDERMLGQRITLAKNALRAASFLP